MSNRKTTSEKIEAARLEKQQAEARIKKLLQEQKADERKARNHRLCKRGGQVEKLLPGLAELTEEQFETFVQKTLLTGFAEKVLRGLSSEDTADDTASKPSKTAENVSADSNAETSTSTRAAG